jgi:hypothetical protein
LPDFSWYNVPKWGKYTELPQNVPNCRKMYQIAVKYTKLPQNVPKGSQMAISYTYRHFSFHAAPPKYVYPNLAFWYANKPSGNPNLVFSITTHLTPRMAYLANCGSHHLSLKKIQYE